jgi:hypothetical protein
LADFNKEDCLIDKDKFCQKFIIKKKQPKEERHEGGDSIFDRRATAYCSHYAAAQHNLLCLGFWR